MRQDKPEFIFNKLAGVGWDVHGYDTSHEELAKFRSAIESYKKQKASVVGERPKFKRKKTGLLGLGKSKLESYKEWKNRPDVLAYHKREKLFTKKNPMPESPYREHRVKTKFDRDTNYKLNVHISHEGGKGKLEQFTSNFAYGDTPTDVPMTKKQYSKVLSTYKEHAKKYKSLSPDDPFIDPGVKGFINKSEALLKNPKTKFIRLEYE